MKAIAIIPARYSSTRFPGKPLIEINGKSMIMRVYDQAMKAALLKDVFVATDDQRIFNHVMQSDGKAIMTSVSHTSGTERCLEAFQILLKKNMCLPDEIIVNIQGDEPFILPDQIDTLINTFDQPGTGIASLMKSINNKVDINNPNCVKVVTGASRQALYFSRAPVPYVRDGINEDFTSGNFHFKHIGMYAYRSGILSEICALKPSPLELAEKLEQLRWLENGYSIFMEVTEYESIAIDTPADLLKVTNIV